MGRTPPEWLEHSAQPGEQLWRGRGTEQAGGAAGTGGELVEVSQVGEEQGAAVPEDSRRPVVRFDGECGAEVLCNVAVG